MSAAPTSAAHAGEVTFAVEYRGQPIVFVEMPGQGWRYVCPLACCRAWHWIDTASGTRHRITSAEGAPVTIVGSLACPCHRGCGWHVIVTDGVARNA